MVISALRGGSGKTILSVGLIAALRKLGNVVTPFKKGPDYIDAGWLAMAAGRRCYNLDTFLIPTPKVLHSFTQHAASGDLSVIEGNRGLFDGIDPKGSTSTAELAKLLKAPVILGLDCTKITRTTAAIVAGCQGFDPKVDIRGVILNRVAGPRHEAIIRQSIEDICGLPVLGAVPRLKGGHFPERHMGLVPTPEHGWVEQAIAGAAELAERYLDLEAIAAIANRAEALEYEPPSEPAAMAALAQKPTSRPKGPRIGVIRDSAFQFYYPENLDAIVHAGGHLVHLSPLFQEKPPQLDGLYIGGGFPETHAKQLADNHTFRNRLKTLADQGLPIYAECGGLMYLGETLVVEEVEYPMTGILPVTYGFSKRPQGHGYTIVRVTRKNPYFKVGSVHRGHEFHYSSVMEWKGKKEDFAFTMERGEGFIDGLDGICYKNVLATYTHMHALGSPEWAEALITAAKAYSKTRKKDV